MKICSDFCTQALSDPGSKQFSKSVQLWLEENCELCGTDNIQGQISDHIFMQNGAYCLCYRSTIFCNIHSYENFGISLGSSSIIQLCDMFRPIVHS